MVSTLSIFEISDILPKSDIFPFSINKYALLIEGKVSISLADRKEILLSLI